MEPTSTASRQHIKNRQKLSLSDTIDIVAKVKFKWVPMNDVAKEYRVSISTISDVICKLRKNPNYIREL